MENINLRKFKTFLGILMVLPAVSCNHQDEKVKDTNILFIAVDDLLPALGCYDNQTVHSPNIDRLARSGVIFKRAYCQVAICNPSRASLMTGLRPDETKVWTLKPHFREEKPDVMTIPQFYKKKGYAAREIGKIYHDPAYHKDPQSWSGPSYYNVTQNGRGHKYNLPENCEPLRTKAAATESANVRDSAYIDGKVCQAAIKVLNEIKDSSFFLAVGFRRPHLPFSVPAKYWDLYSRDQFLKELKDPGRPVDSPEIAYHNSNELRGYEDIREEGGITVDKQLELLHGYFASISYIDAQIGKLLSELKRLDLIENTVIVLYADHGFHLGDFGLWGKTTNFEASARVPLVFKGQGIADGLVNNSIVELIDIYPTLIDLTHSETITSLQGKSLCPVLKNETDFLEGNALTQIGRPYRDAVSSREPGVMGYSIRTNEYRYTEWRNTKDMSVIERELYYMDENNVEQQNIAGDNKMTNLIETFSREIDLKRK